MARPKIYDHLRKDVKFEIRLTKIEKNILLRQAKIHECKSISHYIRKLIKEDETTDRNIQFTSRINKI
jgi:hypothetical protein